MLEVTGKGSRKKIKGVQYKGYNKPTVSSHVTPKTPLTELNLTWTQQELPQRERTKHVHGLHPYLGKFIPQLAEVFLRKYFKPGDTVLDPFAGSGTALVQANELGMHAIGYDVSAFSTLLMRAKTASYDVNRAEAEIIDILTKVEAITQGNSIKKRLLTRGGKNDYLHRWFAPRALFELQMFTSLIRNYEYQNLLKIILTRAARSARLVTHYNVNAPKHPQTHPYYCYKHHRTCKPPTTAFQFLRRYALDTIQRIVTFSTAKTNTAIHIHQGDAAQASIPLVDGVVTSPPYLGLIDYHEQHRYAYELLELKDRRTEEIGATEKGRGKKGIAAYQDEITAVFKNVLNSVKPGGYAIVIANDSHNLYGKIACDLSIAVEGVVRRQVDGRTGRHSTEFYESVFIWRKKC